MELRSGREREMHIGVIMAEDEIIDRRLGIEGSREFIQRFILTFKFIFNVVGQTVPARPAVAETEGQPRMQQAEKELKHTVMEDSAQKPIPERHRPEPVSMAETEALPPDFNDVRLSQPHHPQLLEI